MSFPRPRFAIAASVLAFLSLPAASSGQPINAGNLSASFRAFDADQRVTVFPGPWWLTGKVKGIFNFTSATGLDISDRPATADIGCPAFFVSLTTCSVTIIEDATQWTLLAARSDSFSSLVPPNLASIFVSGADPGYTSDFLDFKPGSGSFNLTVSNLMLPGFLGFLSGQFSGSTSPLPASAKFIKTDMTTQGNWMGKYGNFAEIVAGDSTNRIPKSVVVNLPSSMYVWGTGSDTRWLTNPSVGLSGGAINTQANTTRIGSTFYAFPTLLLDLNLTDGLTHEVALYFLDGDRRDRSEVVQVLDTKNNPLDPDLHTVKQFQEGKYLVWNVRGHVRFKFTVVDGPNAGFSGLFIGPPQAKQP